MTDPMKYPMAEAVLAAYARGEEDEAMLPIVRAEADGSPVGRVKPGDAMIFYNIRGERESELSGPIHEKGVHILEGYLLGTFAATTPLRLSATICFEQSYSGVDGDSASSTELYAILSALSEVPLAQGIAVTGSVDQRGRVQAVGGINEKLEGWFRVCQEAGLTGEQGAVIPRSNVDDLMLRPDVVVAARAGQFRIWAIESITEGLEILTGMPAGTIDAGDTTVLGRAAERLRQFAVAWREFR